MAGPALRVRGGSKCVRAECKVVDVAAGVGLPSEVVRARPQRCWNMRRSAFAVRTLISSSNRCGGFLQHAGYLGYSVGRGDSSAAYFFLGRP